MENFVGVSTTGECLPVGMQPGVTHLEGDWQLQKKEKPRVGDARFRYWYEKEMKELAAKRRKAERIERERQQLRLQAQSQMQHRQQHQATFERAPSKRSWIPAGRAMYDDKWLTTLD